jgi:ribosomal protein S18 acetylase RimI-like enzyme
MKTNQGAISLVGGHTDLLKPQAVAMIRAGALSGEFYVAQASTGEVVGFTLWMPPGQEMFATAEQRALGFNEFMASLSDSAKEYFRTTYLAEFPTFVNSVLGPTGKIDSWWLNMAMVRPEYQRLGIATSLINIVRSKAIAAREPIAFSTTNDANVPVYTSMGFAHLAKKIMPSPWGEWPVHLFGLNAPAAANGA